MTNIMHNMSTNTKPCLRLGMVRQAKTELKGTKSFVYVFAIETCTHYTSLYNINVCCLLAVDD